MSSEEMVHSAAVLGTEILTYHIELTRYRPIHDDVSSVVETAELERSDSSRLQVATEVGFGNVPSFTSYCLATNRVQMKDSLREKLEALVERHEELNQELSDPGIFQQPNRFRELSIEQAEISSIVQIFENYRTLATELDEVKSLLDDDDPLMQVAAQEEASSIEMRIETALNELQKLLLPSDPNDSRNVFLEIRAGTGGSEAALFAGDLARMYKLHVQFQGWRSETVSQHEGEHGGYNKLILRIVGKGAYSNLKFESGTHRVQRVPKTEAQGRIHTSACTVAILPEADKIHDVEIDGKDLRVDTFRASGAGGQHVNRTDSAVRITHLPSGIVVECQDDRSQHKNRAQAMAVLRARLLHAENQKQHNEQSQARRLMVGSGDRSERIRTYNFPQNRVTDHRINLTLYRLDELMAGNLQLIIEPLTAEHQASLMADRSAFQ